MLWLLYPQEKVSHLSSPYPVTFLIELSWLMIFSILLYASISHLMVYSLCIITALGTGEEKKHGYYRNDAGGGGEAEGAMAARVDLTRSVTSLLDAMRDLLSDIHLQPDVPNDADIDEDSED